MEIKNIFGEVLFALEGATTVCELVTAAVAAKKSLRSADLRSAVLSGAVLRSAVLRSADMSGAVLRSAVLSGADLRSADLRSADLSGADLSGAVLSGAVLRSAVLSGAVLRSADMRSAVLSGGMDGVPTIPNIHQVVYAAANRPDALDMGHWHTCETTHCRAGWVVTLAGAGGRALEWAMGTPAAAAVIYLASDPKLEKIPDFYANNNAALEDMKRLAEEEAAQAR
jgi:hypothetical protein